MINDDIIDMVSFILAKNYKEKSFQFGNTNQNLRVCIKNGIIFLPLERNRNKAVSTGNPKADFQIDVR